MIDWDQLCLCTAPQSVCTWIASEIEPSEKTLLLDDDEISCAAADASGDPTTTSCTS